MAIKEHLALLKQGVKIWNQWRDEHENIIPDLSGANLSKANLWHANLCGANLCGANLMEANLMEADLSKADLSKSDLWCTNLSETNLSGVDFNRTKLQGLNLSGLNLSKANLSGLDLSGLNLSKMNLSGANLISVNLNGTNLNGTDLSRADLSKVSLRGADLSKTNLSGANLSEADLSEATLRGADLSKTDLRSANLSGADLCEINLIEADLSNAYLWGANLSGANLSEMHLSRANLGGVNFSGADLSWANLWEANLSGAYLCEANLNGAFLYKSNLRRANFYRANICGANLDGADLIGANLDWTNPGIDSDWNSQLWSSRPLGGNPAGLPDTTVLNTVKFTAYYPREAQEDSRYSFLLYAHTGEAFEIIAGDIEKFRDELGNRVPSPKTAKKTTQIRLDTPITVVPECDQIEFDPPSLTKKWSGEWTRFGFDFRPTTAMSGDTLFVRVSIQITTVEVAHINCAVEVIEQKEDSDQKMGATDNPLAEAKLNSNTSEPYQNIFISYSRKDKEVTKVYKLVQEAVGNIVFMDTYSIRAGEDWRSALALAIRKADVFQLFWSNNSAGSPNVRYEWMYALKHKCPETRCVGFIRPVCWCDPIKPLPPDVLGHLSFKYVPLNDLVTSRKRVI